jgi:hypothetical protein
MSWALVRDGQVVQRFMAPAPFKTMTEGEETLFDASGRPRMTIPAMLEVQHTSQVFTAWSVEERRKLGLYDLILPPPCPPTHYEEGDRTFEIDDEKGVVTEKATYIPLPEDELNRRRDAADLQGSVGGLTLLDQTMPRAVEDLLEYFEQHLRKLNIEPDRKLLPEPFRKRLVEKTLNRGIIARLAQQKQGE